RLEPARRARPCDGVRRVRAVLARLERRAQNGVRQVRRVPAAAAGWQLADGPFLWVRGLDPAAVTMARPCALARPCCSTSRSPRPNIQIRRPLERFATLGPREPMLFEQLVHLPRRVRDAPERIPEETSCTIL